MCTYVSLLTQQQSDIDESEKEPDKIKAKEALLTEIGKQTRAMPYAVFRAIYKKHMDSMAEEAEYEVAEEAEYEVSLSSLPSAPTVTATH